MRRDRSHRSPQSQVLAGALVIGMGVLFLLDNLGFVEFRRALPFWPLFLIAVGIVKISDTGARNRYAFGGAMIFAGGVLLLNHLGFFYVSWNTLWPVMLIGLGAVLMYRAATGRRAREMPLKDDAAACDAVVDITAILGGVERRVTSPEFRGGEITAIMGGCELDMRGASIQGEAVLNVFACFGGITIKCPPDWTVVLHGTPILGGFEEKTAPPPDNSKRLVIEGYVLLGGLEVRN